MSTIILVIPARTVYGYKALTN